ncbi:MAG TPA: hypothetical protein PLT13_14060 [Spirochaetota bacterium]|nr:hypothetical protein [Spirochaetota bacterium]
MKVFKTLFPAMVLVTLAAGNLFASHYDYLTDLSAEWIAGPNRLAVTDSADAAAYNPAGTAFMKDGLYVNVSNQTILNYYGAEVDSAYPGPTDYESHKASPLVPNGYLVYKQDNWAAFGAVNILCGGGSLSYANGLPSVNEAVRMAATSGLYGNTSGSLGENIIGSTTAIFTNAEMALMAAGTPDGAMLTKLTSSKLAGGINVDQKSMGIAPSVGGSYRLSDMVSVSLGARYISMMKRSIATFVRGGNNGIDVKLLDVELTADGLAGIVGTDIKPTENLNIGISLESPTKLEYTVDVKTDLSYQQRVSKANGNTDGGKFRFDLPAKLNLGAEYNVTDNFKVMVSGIYYFSKWMKMEKLDSAGNRVNLTEKTHSYEIGTGFEWKFMQNVAWTGGVVWDYINQPENQTSDALYKNECINIGTGFSIYPNDKTKFTVGFMRNIYPDLERKNGAVVNNGIPTGIPTITPETKYDMKYHKESWVVAVGMQYNFM